MGFDFQERTIKLLDRLKLLGVWRYKTNFFGFDLYFLYSLVLCIYHNFHNVAQIINICNNYNNMSEWTSSGLLVLTETLTNLKAYCIMRNRASILRINKIVAKPSFQPKNSYQEKKAKSTFKIFDVMYVAHCCGPTFTILFFALYPVAEIRKGNRTLPFHAWYPYDDKVSPFFEFSYFHQLSSCFVQAMTHVNADCLAINFIATLIVQLDLLEDNLRNISKRSDLDAALYECITHHKEILSCFSEVYQILNMNMLGQFILSTTALCLTTLEMSEVDLTSTHFVALVVYELALMLELLLFCWWGNELITRSELIPRAAFECNWLRGSTSFRKDLTFFIFRTQKPMILYAVDFFKISLDSFILIIKNSYSFYAVLRHVNSDDNEK